jgi:hypothetical protein
MRGPLGNIIEFFMERIVVHASPRHMLRKLVWCLSLLAIGAGLLVAGRVRWLGWVLALVGGGYSLVLLRALGEEKERLVVDDSGIRDSALPLGTIGWEEVLGASVQQISGVSVIALELRDPERLIRRLPATRQFIARKALEAGLPGIYVTVAGTDADPGKIAEAIRQRVR